jgi:hypothetical protein
MHQSAEWGMHAVQVSFLQLKATLPYEEYGERKHILTSLLLLFNLQANLVGIRRIMNFYYPVLVCDANQEFLGH